jgi:hypothetical protein
MSAKFYFRRFIDKLNMIAQSIIEFSRGFQHFVYCVPLNEQKNVGIPPKNLLFCVPPDKPVCPFHRCITSIYYLEPVIGSLVSSNSNKFI